MSVGDNSRYAVKMNRYFLVPLGIWPLGPDASFALRLLQKGAVMTHYWLICFLLMPYALHIFLEETNLAKKLKAIGPISFNLMAIGKYCSLVSGIKEFGECFEHVEEDWKFSKDRCAKQELLIMRRKARVGHLLTLLCAGFMYGGGIFFRLIMPLTVGHFASVAFRDNMAKLQLENSTNYDIHARAPKILTYPVYETLMDVQRSPHYEIVFTAQFIAGFVLYTITIAAYSLVAGFVVHVCAQLEIVMYLLHDFVRGNDAESGVKMKGIVDKHIRALGFAKRVEENLNVICFIEFVGCTLNICFLGYYFVTEWENEDQSTISTVTYCILLMSFMFNIFIFATLEKCSLNRVGEVTYSVDWYQLPGKKAVDITLIILISNCYPAKITAGRMIFLSMSSFSSVMKAALSYMNLLRAVMI